MESCKNCACQCKPVSYNCIASTTGLDIKGISESHINNATNDISELIGIDCAEELCAALATAATEATDNGGDMEDYLPAKWLNLITNKYFKSWYSYKVMWYFMIGTSISSIQGDNLVVHSVNDPNYQGAYNAADSKERKRLENVAKMFYDKYRESFLNQFWYRNIAAYPCAVLECGCCRESKCKTHGNNRPKIGMVAIN